MNYVIELVELVVAVAILRSIFRGQLDGTKQELLKLFSEKLDKTKAELVELNKKLGETEAGLAELTTGLDETKTKIVELNKQTTALHENLDLTKKELEKRIEGLVTSDRLAQTDATLRAVINRLGRVLKALGKRFGKAGKEVVQAGDEFDQMSADQQGGSGEDSR